MPAKAKRGRPVAKDPIEVIVSLRLTRRQYEFIAKLAAADDRTVSQLFRRIVDRMITEEALGK